MNAEKFLIISSLGANAKSMIFYNRVKGEAEAELKKLSLPHLFIFRPSLLLGDRKEQRTGEKTAASVYKVLSPIFKSTLKKYKGVEAKKVANAMMQTALQNDKPFQIIERTKYSYFSSLFTILCLLFLFSCKQRENNTITIRPMADTVGFAQYDWQMDSIMKRINRFQGDLLSSTRNDVNLDMCWKAAICPHDDYSYVGFLYPAVLKDIKAKTILLFGVAHKARLMKLENQIIFDSYDYWKAPYGPVKVSHLREEIIALLPPGIFQVNDSMQKMEHSLEALIPFLQFYNRNIEIVPVLVPSMSFEKMNQIANPLADVINKIVTEKNGSGEEILSYSFRMMLSIMVMRIGEEKISPGLEQIVLVTNWQNSTNMKLWKAFQVI